MDDYAFDPAETPSVEGSKTWDLKKASLRLKEHGYVLLAYGSIEVVFHRTDAERDKYGLLPDEALVKLSRKAFDSFLRGLRK
jgi:hypothetical protein